MLNLLLFFFNLTKYSNTLSLDGPIVILCRRPLQPEKENGVIQIQLKNNNKRYAHASDSGKGAQGCFHDWLCRNNHCLHRQLIEV